MTGTLLDAALDYAARGWPVVPILPGEKRPAIDRWTERATTDTNLITAWWHAHPDHGVGIATGTPAGFWVLDVDGEIGFESLRRLEATHGELPPTYTVATGSGGLHLYYRLPAFDVRNDAGKRLGDHLDVRGTGGQVVAPPTVHPCGNAYRWTAGDEPADTPRWLADLLRDPLDVGRERSPLDARPDRRDRTDVRPGDRFNDATTWPELLETDGWQLDHTDRNGEQHWTRPGKNKGTSATVGYQGLDVLHVFTSSVQGLDPESTYSRFAYYTATRHDGDYQAAARALGDAHDRDQITRWLAGATAISPLRDVDTGDTLTVELAQWVVDWPHFWTHVDTDADWLIEPFLAKGRQHAIHAGAKTGKSLILLEMCAALATGRAIFDRPAGEPVAVLYVDYEMSEADLRDRLETFGYSPADDLGQLHYCLLPSIAPLDSHEGGLIVLQAAIHYRVALVVVDTTARAVAGPENDADTIRAFYRHCGLALKSAGIALARVDHSGKDAERGQRGSSAKNDDVDIVWSMVRLDGGRFVLKATHRRMGWVPEQVTVALVEDEDGHEHFGLVADAAGWPAGTAACAELLDAHGVPIDIAQRNVRAYVGPDVQLGRNAVVRAAVKYRQSDEYRLRKMIDEGGEK